MFLLLHILSTLDVNILHSYGTSSVIILHPSGIVNAPVSNLQEQ